MSGLSDCDRTDAGLRELILPWPARALHPNARVHWRTKAAATKDARHSAFHLARAAGWAPGILPADGKLSLWVDFIPPDRRRRDDDGMPAAFKAWRDGLADALGIDDNRFRSFPYLSDREVVKSGCVRVRITLGPEQSRTLDQENDQSKRGGVQ